VQQEPALFSTTIQDNILYGFDKADLGEEEVDAKMYTAMDQASCQFINDPELFPDGVKTLIGERGKTLSGGQK
jgi:ABC-type multidrug transport system fused ATPase/permease subunit